FAALLLVAVALTRAAAQMPAQPPTEPPEPKASAAVQPLLEEVVRLIAEQKPAEALQKVVGAREAAKAAHDLPGQARARRLEAWFLQAMHRPQEALVAYREAAAAFQAAGDGPGQVEALL